VIVADRPEVAVEPGYRGLLALADVVGYRLEAFQRKIARAVGFAIAGYYAAWRVTRRQS
jgi:hypothetical protein